MALNIESLGDLVTEMEMEGCEWGTLVNKFETQQISVEKLDFEEVVEPMVVEPVVPKPEVVSFTQIYSNLLEQNAYARKNTTSPEQIARLEELHAVYTLTRAWFAICEMNQEPYITVSKTIVELQAKIDSTKEKDKKKKLLEEIGPLRKIQNRYMKWYDDIRRDKPKKYEYLNKITSGEFILVKCMCMSVW